MDVKQKYIREGGYDVDENFVEQLQDLDIRTGIKIAKFIEKNVKKIPYSTLVSTVLGGVVVDDDNTPITFAVEIIKDLSVGKYSQKNLSKASNIILSDLSLIDMDEYLDLLNLNKKSNENRESRSSKKNNPNGL